MAVGPEILPILHPVQGVRLGTASAGIKKAGRRDLVVMAFSEGTNVSGLYTTNAFCAAPVQVAREHMAEGMPRYFLINTGNANAGTGEPGMTACRRTCDALAELTQVSARAVLPFSTGVIGELLPADRVCSALPAALSDLVPAGWERAAWGIMTTDTRPKGASLQLSLSGTTVTITGITKGAGMIKPNMATMLAFVATDARVAPEDLQALQKEAVGLSFNRITVDGDTSTNDCSMLAATGASGLALSPESPDWDAFRQAMLQIYHELAEAIVRDGEGATKLVTVSVETAASEEEALQVAYTVAESPLVKTALFASDPNWGRILAAVGRAGVSALDVSQVAIWLDAVQIVAGGGVHPDYREAAGAAVMKQDEISIRIALQRGSSSASVLTTDLSYDYVKINAEYRS